MQFHIIIVNFMVLPWFIIGQKSYSYSGQYGFPINNQFEKSTNAQISSSNSNMMNYLVGNFSESYSFQVAPSSIQVAQLSLNGYPLYIKDIGFSNDTRFRYDEQKNHLTILSLDLTTVGSYLALAGNWKEFTNIVSAINVSSLEIHNFHVSEDNNGSSRVSCSVSIIHSTFQLSQPSLQSNNQILKSTGIENLPRLDLFISTRTLSSVLLNKKIYNDTLNEQYFTRRITLEHPLTRADHNGTIQCQVESNNNIDIYLIKNVSIDIEYGPNLETGALPKINLEGEILKMIEMECQIEANPYPSYVWYEILSNISTGIMSDNDQHNSYERLSSTEHSVFGITRRIQRIYQDSGQYTMQCQAQSRGKTVKQEFFISIHLSSTIVKTNSYIDRDRQTSYKTPMFIGITIGCILLLLIIAIIIATIMFLKRRKMNPNKKNSIEKLSDDKQEKSRWGSLPIDYSKYKHESLKTDSSSTSHLVESVETTSMQVPPPVPPRPSPLISTQSSYRQTPLTSVSLSYRQASALPGFRPSNPTRSYSSEHDDADDISTSINAMPLTINRSRANTPLGSRRSLSESIQSLRSNQQTGISLPVKKRSHDLPPILPKREQKTPSPNSFQAKNDYQHHHYHNPTQLRAQQQIKTDNTSSEEEEFEQQQMNQISEDSVATASTTASSGYNQVDFHPEQGRRIITSAVPQQMIVNQPIGKPRDEVPPSYHQVTNTSSPSHAYIYQEPTEV
ncbi:unnamed protein product [Rotaria sordida]|uniref:Ig-like domain-containing protein n=1 Tax=Rotaria sordida TaxID=392033 RepID=A0A814QWX6_9BILA|nr:unnamed protein product [Rotaria sordida]